MRDGTRLAAILSRHTQRIVSRAAELRDALSVGESADRPELGLSLASRFPELEAIVALVSVGRFAQTDLAERAAIPAKDAELLREIADLIRDRPALAVALARAFPGASSDVEPPALVVLVGDPLVDESGVPLRRDGRPGWRIPWGSLETRLRELLHREPRSVRIEFHPATWQRALSAVPRARYLVLLCHGSQTTLAFESEEGCEIHRVSLEHDLPKLFAGTRPELALILTCQGAAAARVAHEAGVPYAIGIDEDDPLEWRDAQDLVACFLESFAAGQPPALALEQARIGTRVSERLRLFSTPTARVTPLLPGAPTEDERPEWLDLAPRPGFVARERELERILQAVARPGLIVLHGAPGIGKTELAYAVLQRSRLRRVPSAGSALISLESGTSEGAIASAIIAALGAAAPTEPTIESAASALGSAPRLVILDDAEHCLESSGTRAAFHRLLKLASDMNRARILVMSRERIIVDVPCQQIPVGSLHETEEARELLMGLLRESSDVEALRHVLADPELPALLRELGGHALSTRIAVGRLSVGDSVQELVRDAERGCLTGSAAAVLPDEEIARSLEPSWEKLTVSEREFWGLIASLPDGIPKGARLGDSDDSDLARLRRLCLLEEASDRRFCLPPIRRFVDSRSVVVGQKRRSQVLTAVATTLVGELEQAREGLGTPRARASLALFSQWRRTLDVLFETVPQALRLRLISSAAMLASYAGLSAQADQWLHSIEWPSDADSSPAEAYEAAGHVARLRDRGQEAAERFEHANRLFRKAGDRLGEGRSLLGLGDILVNRGSLAEARHRYEEALRRFDEAGDRKGEAVTLRSLGDLSVLDARLDAARRHYEGALEGFRAIEDRLGEANALRSLGDLELRTGRGPGAQSYYQKSLEAFREVSDRLGEANTLQGLGDVHLHSGDLERAEACYLEALREFREIGIRLGEANVLKSLGDVDKRRSHLERARRQYEQALAVYREISLPLGEGNVLSSLGDLSMRMGRRAEARGQLEEALAVFRRIGDRLGEANTLRRLGDAERHADRLEEARQRYRESVLAQRGIGNRLGQANALLGLGQLELTAGRQRESEQLLREALDLYREVTNRPGEGHALRALGEIALVNGQTESAQNSLESALELFREIDDHLGEANVQHRLGELDMQRGDLKMARRRLASALEVFRSLADSQGEANTLLLVAQAELVSEHKDEARRGLQRALDLYRQLGDRLGEGNALRGLAEVSLDDDPRGAFELARRSAGLASEIGDPLGAAGARVIEARALVRSGEVERAVREFAAAYEVAKEAGSLLSESTILYFAGEAFDALRDPERASLFRAASAALRLEAGLPVAEVHATQLDVLRERGGELLSAARHELEALAGRPDVPVA